MVSTELVTSCNNEGKNTLCYTIINNQLEVAQDIIKRKVCYSTKKYNGFTVVHLAADIGNPRMISLILT